MNINLEYYKIFYEVAKEQNITKASENLNISQPAISKTIKLLEEKLGGTLFVRTKKGVILTEEGKEFYSYITKAMEYINSAENKFSDLINLETGVIKIGINSTLTKEFLLSYLEIFNKSYPKIDIQITNGITSHLINELKNGLIDIVFLNLNDKDYGNDIDIIKCKKIHDVFIASKKYSELNDKVISLNELKNYPLIFQAKGSNTRNFLDNFLKEKNITLKPNIELASYSLVTEFCKAGFGIGYAVKEFIQKDLNDGKIFSIKIKETIPERYIGFAISNKHLPSFSTKKLMEIINKK
mgnify:FL=1